MTPTYSGGRQWVMLWSFRVTYALSSTFDGYGYYRTLIGSQTHLHRGCHARNVCVDCIEISPDTKHVILEILLAACLNCMMTMWQQRITKSQASAFHSIQYFTVVNGGQTNVITQSVSTKLLIAIKLYRLTILKIFSEEKTLYPILGSGDGPSRASIQGWHFPDR